MLQSSPILKLVHKRTWSSLATLFLGSQRSGMQNYVSTRSLREICFESSIKPPKSCKISNDTLTNLSTVQESTSQYVPYKTSSARSWDVIKGQVSNPTTAVGGMSLIRGDLALVA